MRAAGGEVASGVVELETVRRRLEFLLAGLHGRALRVDAVPPPPRRGWTMRGVHALGRALAPHRVVDVGALANVPDARGATVQLPRVLRSGASGDAAADATTRYRALALIQAERLVRGSESWLADADDVLAQHCFQLREGAAVDRAVARRVRGIGPVLQAMRAEALASRPPLDALPPLARELELLRRAALAPDALTQGDEGDDGPDASRRWAATAAARLAAHPAASARALRRLAALPPVVHWGRAPERRAPEPTDDVPLTELPRVTPRSRDAPPQTRLALPLPGSSASEGDARSREQIATTAPTHGETPDAPVAAPTADFGRTQTLPDDVVAIPYPEWDERAGRLRPRGVTVLVQPAPEGDATWADTVLRDQAALVRSVRSRFEPLRARRARLPRQRQGDELDVGACVAAYADRAAGQPGDERPYVATRPARRPLAIALLVDVSGSTDARVSEARDDTRQIIDVEKEAVLLAGEALDALGDPFAVLTFSSRGAHAVRVHTVKGFAERHDATVRRRVSAMRPAGNTRLGAAIRHTTALLAAQRAGHRLLLLLSDGRPNDMDGYQGRYAVEDARQAVHEARALGVFPFCLTVDREESEYLPHIFGAAGHTVLRRPDQLPVALVRAVRQLLGAGAR
jgi:nitric oxide reductase NorD protein